ncbi:MAG: hypothetical protein AAGD28_07865 [Bacteroidota bacterium]
MKNRILVFCLFIFFATSYTQAQEEVKAIFVGNNQGGTVSIIDSRSLEIVKTIDIIPDRNEKHKQSITNKYINRILGPKYVDDIDILPDGKRMVNSRPFFSDVALFDLNSGEMIWKLKLKHRPDHQVMTKDGKSLFVSLLAAKKGVKIDLEKKEVAGYYKTGSRPHSIVLNEDDSKLYNGSLKGNDIVIIDTKTLDELDRLPFPAGVRPFKLSPDESTIYAQLSYCHCLVEYKVSEKKVVRQIDLPIPEEVKGIELKDYPFQAAHHGIGLSKNGKYISLAGTISNYVGIYTFPELEKVKVLETGIEPSWITDSFEGDIFFVSARKSNKVYAYSYSQQMLIKEFELGDYPQRMVRGTWKRDSSLER